MIATCFLSFWPSDADVNTQKMEESSRVQAAICMHLSSLRVLSLENMVQNCDLFYYLQCPRRDKISKEPGLGPEKPINESLLDIT